MNENDALGDARAAIASKSTSNSRSGLAPITSPAASATPGKPAADTFAASGGATSTNLSASSSPSWSYPGSSSGSGPTLHASVASRSGATGASFSAATSIFTVAGSAAHRADWYAQSHTDTVNESLPAKWTSGT